MNVNASILNSQFSILNSQFLIWSLAHAAFPSFTIHHLQLTIHAHMKVNASTLKKGWRLGGRGWCKRLKSQLSIFNSQLSIALNSQFSTLNLTRIFCQRINHLQLTIYN